MDKSPQSGKLFVDESNFDANWEDVLNTINIESLPIRFVKHLLLNLKNKDKFIIDVQEIVKQSHSLDVATKRVNAIITQHKNNIETIDFSIKLDDLVDNINKSRDAFTKKVNFKIKRQGKKKK